MVTDRWRFSQHGIHTYGELCTPLVDSQEYRAIFDQTAKKQDGSDVTGTDNKLRDLLSTYKQELEINTKIIEEAEKEVPKSGYDTSSFLLFLLLMMVIQLIPEEDTADKTTSKASSSLITDLMPITPSQEGYDGYMTGDGLAPNRISPVTPELVSHRCKHWRLCIEIGLQTKSFI